MASLKDMDHNTPFEHIADAMGCQSPKTSKTDRGQKYQCMIMMGSRYFKTLFRCYCRMLGINFANCVAPPSDVNHIAALEDLIAFVIGCCGTKSSTENVMSVLNCCIFSNHVSDPMEEWEAPTLILFRVS